MKTDMIRPDRHKELFLDDYAIESTSGVQRTLHQPEKQGPVLAPDRSREQVLVQSSSSPQWNPEKGIWEWWHIAFYDEPPYQGPGSNWSVHPHYATSTDGVHWEAPSLGLYEYRGSKDNNVAYHSQLDFLRRRGMRGLHLVEERRLMHVIRDEHDADPQRRYKGIFTDQHYSGRYPGLSPDGFRWTYPQVPPVPSDDTSQVIYDDIADRYVLTTKQRTEWGRSVWLSTSQDFVDWTEPKLIMRTDEIDRENRRERVQRVVEDPEYLSPPIVEDEDYVAQVYMMPLMTYEGIYIGFPKLFNPAGPDPRQMNHVGLSQVELAVARDLYDWQRVADRAIFIGVEPWDGVNYDTTQAGLCGAPVVRDDEIWVYYGAVRFRGLDELYDDEYQEYFKDMGALCLAKLRLDGFVSLDAEGEGTVTTRPFLPDGGSLYVNADAQGGELRAEVLDAETMKPIHGLDESKCDPVRGDLLRGRLSWEGRAGLAADRAVRVRFRLRHASLYAFWTEVD